MKEVGTPLAERFQAFPWILGDLLFPFMMEYLVSKPQTVTCGCHSNLCLSCPGT